MRRTLNPLERSWLLLESSNTPMHLGALLIFQLPKNAEPSHVGRLAERLREANHTVSPWDEQLKGRHRLQAHWESNTATDLEHHVRHSALPAPGGERELGVLVSRLHSRSLDLNRPPWEFHVIEGLHGGRFAIYLKMHHALADADDFLRRVTDWLSTDAKQRGRAVLWELESAPSTRLAAGEQLKASFSRLLQPGEGAKTALALGSSLRRFLRGDAKPGKPSSAPYRVPRSALNVGIGPQRRFATQQYPRARLNAVAKAGGVSVDDLLLYLCGSALRRFFKEYNALPDQPLLAAMPGQRKRRDDDAQPYGAIGFVSLGTQHSDPHKRLAEVQRSAKASRAQLDAVPEPMIPLYNLTTAAPYLLGQVSGLRRAVPALFNLIITIQPGPTHRLYLDGSKLEAMYPMFPLVQGSALSISCLHYSDTVNIGFCGARETLPSLQRMAVYTGQALTELEELLAGESP